MPALNMRLLRPTLLVDLNRVAGLDQVAIEDGALRVGATVRQADLRLHAHPALAPCSHTSVTRSPATGEQSADRRACGCGGRASARLVAFGGTAVAASTRGTPRDPRGEPLPRPVHDRARGGRARRRDGLAEPAEGDGSAFEELAQRGGDYALSWPRLASEWTRCATSSARSPRADRASRSTRSGRASRRRGGRAVGLDPRITRIPPAALRDLVDRVSAGEGMAGDPGRRQRERSPLARGRRASAAPLGLPPPPPRPYRNARRLRARRVRRVHGAARRRGGARVPPPRRPGGRL